MWRISATRPGVTGLVLGWFSRGYLVCARLGKWPSACSWPDAQDAAQRAHADALVIEGVGGLLVPFADAHVVRDLARELALPVVVVAARPGHDQPHSWERCCGRMPALLAAAGAALGVDQLIG